ncbi:MAG: vanadium-dependent haloperoxidase [Bacteroidota bacterium]
MKSQVLSRLSLVLILLFGSISWWGCQKNEESNPLTVAPVEYSAKLPQEWMEFAYNAVKKQGWFALDASRFYAYSAITAYESMVYALPNYRTLAGQLQGLESLPQPASDKTYDWGIVLCHAMPKVMDALMPNMALETRVNMETLVENQATRMRNENTLSEAVVADSKAFADQLADAIIKWSETDNRLGMESLIYTPPSRVGNPQYWDGATLNQTFMMPFWWTSRPFVINSYRLCEPPPPYTYSTDPNSDYYKDVKEVYDASFDPAKVAIGNYWANNPGKSGTPAGSWLAIGNQLVDQQRLDLATTLRMYVLLTIGTRDGFIACWYAKYKNYLQRPVSYIRDVMGHTDWSSPVPTPPYPDYTSGTSVNAGASSETLTRLFGNKTFSDFQHQDKGYGFREYASFKEAGREAFHSRIYGGVHMRRACELGFEQGECISEYVWNNLKFNK